MLDRSSHLVSRGLESVYLLCSLAIAGIVVEACTWSCYAIRYTTTIIRSPCLRIQSKKMGSFSVELGQSGQIVSGSYLTAPHMNHANRPTCPLPPSRPCFPPPSRLVPRSQPDQPFRPNSQYVAQVIHPVLSDTCHNGNTLNGAAEGDAVRDTILSVRISKS